MNNIEKTLKYYELLMVYNDTSKVIDYDLPDGYHFEFYKPGDEKDWVNIHISSGEFMSVSEGLGNFWDFYGDFINELDKRCLFIVNDDKEKVGTVTISLLSEKEYGYDAVVDWFAVKKEYQGCHLAKPLISRFIKLANELGHNKLLLHTQTHTWLAAKLYLDLGFVPFMMDKNIEGWKILKTITNHEKLKEVDFVLENEMYSKTAQLIVEKLNGIFGESYEYSIWFKNGRHDVEVNYNGELYKYKYVEHDDGTLDLIED